MNRCVCLILTIAFAGALHAQTNPLSTETKASFREVIDNIVKSGEMMPEINFDYKPVPTVRSFGEILGHVADYNYIFCGLAKGEQNMPDNEKNRHTKADLLAALRRSIQYCYTVYNPMNDADGVQMMKFFGGTRSKLGILNLNVAHDNEHYGNVVTYLRLKGLVPPSTGGGQ